MKLTLTTLALLALVPAVNAQDAPAKDPPAQAPAAASTTFTAEQLEQIVAPIALHPDTLLAQIMMAATYPLEVVEAHRWVQKNASLKEKALEEALKQHEWDPSVKSLCVLPDVLKQMNDNLDWTQDLGDAFLGQKTELMQTVQTMRRKALEAGTLKSSEQQKVSEDGQIVIIESTKTEVVYVPTYSPTVVYGSWYYPYWYYPPMYVAPRPGAVLFAFSVGFFWGAGGWGGCNWHSHDVNININNFNNFNKNTSIDARKYNIDNARGNQGSWSHNPEHRKGVNYKNPQTAQKYGGAPGANRVSRDQARGFDRAAPKSAPAGGVQRPAAGNTPAGDVKRPASGTPNAGSGARPGAGTGATGTKPAPKPTPKPGGGAGGALSGSRSPGLDRSASTRGATSRAGGGARTGGGRRR
ncbi:MAG: DUF3300 domain-containing protein [Planctomycetes bacterium]|nr:DUF3300 domain-containing protein [Planctomycetota bacterium]